MRRQTLVLDDQRYVAAFVRQKKRLYLPRQRADVLILVDRF